MRVWDIHPGYLDRGGLLGQHTEIHAVWSVLRGCKGGYSRHPEVLRWRGHEARLAIVHEITVREMGLRGFDHASPLDGVGSSDNPPSLPSRLISPGEQLELVGAKLARRGRQGRIPLPKRISWYWAQHKYSVMARGYRRYRDVARTMARREDCRPSVGEDMILQIMEEMAHPITPGAMRNTSYHLWGYVKRPAGAGERKVFFEMVERGEYLLALEMVYRIAERHRIVYLLHSSVFADAPFEAPEADKASGH